MKKKNNVKDSSLIKYVNEDTNEMKKFIFILIGVALVAVLLYLVSSKLLIKDGVKNTEKETPTETISYEQVNVGNIFNRPETEYYVFAYDSEDLKAKYYESLINTYESEDSKIYSLDLNIPINKQYVKEDSNKDATNSNEIALKNPTLIKIKNQKIVKYLENIDEIEAELK